MKLTALLALLIATSINSVTASPNSSFASLKKLVGVWKIEGDDSAFHIAYELTANETVLIESWVSNGKKHSLTVYHLDNDRLIATHYCPQGNQPRLAMTSDSTRSDIEFDFLDATNLADKEVPHQRHLRYGIAKDFNTMTRSETYRQNNEDSVDMLQLERIHPHNEAH